MIVFISLSNNPVSVFNSKWDTISSKELPTFGAIRMRGYNSRRLKDVR